MSRMTELQEAIAVRLVDLDPDASLDWDDVRAVVSRARGRLPARLQDDQDADGDANAFLRELGPLFGPEDLADRVRSARRRNDDLGWTHIEFQQVERSETQFHEGAEWIDVFGGRIAAHYDPEGDLVEVQSSCWRDIDVSLPPRVSPTELRERLLEQDRVTPGFQTLYREMRTREERMFPLMERPRLVVYPWKGGFPLAWMVYGYAPIDVEDRSGRPTGERTIAFGEIVVDAVTGDIIVFSPTRKHVDNPDTGSGTGVTPLGAPAVRSLDIIRVDTTDTYRLRDKTRARDIVTYDAAASTSWSSTSEITAAINSGSLPVSTDDDGDKNWNRVATNTTDAQRTASQQPEVDVHFYCRQLYEWYDALAGGRAGWDAGAYSSPPVPPQAVSSVSHVHDDGAGTSRSVNAFMDMGLVGGNWIAFLAYFDGDPTATCTTPSDRAYDYLGGSPFIVGHEYQHAITDFTFEDSAGNPGLTYLGWLAAVHEGLSDVFGGLFSERWTPGPEISSVALVFRNLAFPRDPNSWVNRTGNFPCGLSNSNKDHFADRNLDGGFRYDRGTILAHCAYLTGAGGVHQRASRAPVLIPVESLGRQVVGGKDVLRAARIWYRALAWYFSTHGNLTGVPANDENTFRTLRNACVSAAVDIFGANSREHLTTILAFYAVGLHPAGATYGADPTFLPWGASWWRSRPYIGLPSPDWASLDLFVNNGGLSEWNAQVNVIGTSGVTAFENTVYCRVRNVGDQAANNVQVTFEYAAAGMGIVLWLPVTDKNGVAQTLNVGTLAPGASNFADAAQNSPPSAASVKWYIPPLAPGTVVDHFCLRATVTSSNDVNSWNNTVQSNFSYVPYAGGAGMRMGFTAGNPTDEPIELDLRVDSASLPKGWEATIAGPERKELEPGEEVAIELEIAMGEGADLELEPPLDGLVEGTAYGALAGQFAGTLTETRYDDGVLAGLVAGHLGELPPVTGRFEGRLHPLTGEIEGTIVGETACSGSDLYERVCFGIKGCLRPHRRIDVSQYVRGEAIGGVTIQVQVSMPNSPCWPKLPTTGTTVNPETGEP